VTDTQADNEQLAAHALRHLQGFLTVAALDAHAERESSHGDTVTLAITGPEARLLVGPHGQTLDALQYLLSLMTNKGSAQRLRITVDADGYRARRAQTLTDFAQELAAQVGKSGQEAITDPLNAMDRRIIHTALTDHPDVETYSEGDDPNRYVVISPRMPSKET
jgi:spoIIIJ-associated protein